MPQSSSRHGLCRTRSARTVSRAAPEGDAPCTRSPTRGCRAGASSASRRVAAPRRRPEDEDRKILLDIVEAVLHTGCDVRDAADLDRRLLVRYGEPGPPRDHVVDLVLRVRFLIVDRP